MNYSQALIVLIDNGKVGIRSGVFDVEADRIELGVQLRIQDNTYQSYSNYIEMNKMPDKIQIEQ
jgi:hypothetical protein